MKTWIVPIKKIQQSKYEIKNRNRAAKSINGSSNATNRAAKSINRSCQSSSRRGEQEKVKAEG
jgi:hypothetical protein